MHAGHKPSISSDSRIGVYSSPHLEQTAGNVSKKSPRSFITDSSNINFEMSRALRHNVFII